MFRSLASGRFAVVVFALTAAVGGIGSAFAEAILRQPLATGGGGGGGDPKGGGDGGVVVDPCTLPPTPGVGWSGCDMTEAAPDLVGADLAGANLTDTVLTGLDLSEVLVNGTTTVTDTITDATTIWFDGTACPATGPACGGRTVPVPH